MTGEEDFGGEWVEKPDGTLEWIERPKPGAPPRRLFDAPLEDDEWVDDPEALRAAEESVARDEQPQRSAGAPRRDGHWVPVAQAHDAYSFDVGRLGEGMQLQAMAGVLRDAGIEVGWDPYEPTQTFTGKHFGPRSFFLLVPEHRLPEARRLLEEAFPEEFSVEGPPSGYGTDQERGYPDRVDEETRERHAWREVAHSSRWLIAVAFLLLVAYVLLRASR